MTKRFALDSMDDNPNPRRMRWLDPVREYLSPINVGAGLATVGVVAGAIALSAFTEYVKPNEWGIKQREINAWGILGDKGILPERYETGIKFVFPVAESMHKFPKDTQVLDLSKDTLRGGEREGDMRFEPAVNIQTSDGFWVNLDVSILYRITDPYKVITTFGGGRLYEEIGIVSKAEPILKATLGQLGPEDFYDVEKEYQSKKRQEMNSTPSFCQVE